MTISRLTPRLCVSVLFFTAVITSFGAAQITPPEEFLGFEVGEDRGMLYMAMEWVEGDPITHLCYTEQAHADAAATLCLLADKHCEGRLIGTGGGGYNRQNLARAWTRVVQAFVEAA